MLSAIIGLGILGLIFGISLSLASKKFFVKLDPREEAVLKALPGTNCGACGFPGCAGLARAIIKGEAAANGCTSGGAEVIKNVSRIMGVEAVVKEKEVAVIMCKGGRKEAMDRFRYIGVHDCKAAAMIAGGNKACAYGCLGLGTCERVCPFDAIKMDDNYLPVVDEEKCTGCTLCAVNCPKVIIKMIPISNKIHIRCNSLDKGAVTRKNCTVGCIACRKCEKVCPIGAITVENNLAVINPLKCDNCRKCVPVCPTDTIENYFGGEPRYASLMEEEAENVQRIAVSK
ncbi:MAG: RnfABCDGE type electron transport complex subunit B [Nitrospinae bacterium]|nr:RnfABCDGE type electron transport complex subunit B [Nitrospinota bacterium]